MKQMIYDDIDPEGKALLPLCLFQPSPVHVLSIDFSLHPPPSV